MVLNAALLLINRPAPCDAELIEDDSPFPFTTNPGVLIEPGIIPKTPGQRDIEVIFQMNHQDAPYVITKPLHETQKIIKNDSRVVIFSIKVILNFELEREILGFGSRIKILRPRNLKKRIIDQYKEALSKYNL